MSTPSTKIIPAWTSSVKRAPFSSMSSARPLRPLKIRSGSIPTDSASSAWSRIRLWSPWNGNTYAGRVRLSISFSSSREPWPETWIGASAAVTTVAPIS